jgi:signal transduction histidine kinase
VQPRRADLARVLGDAARALRPLSERKRLDLAVEVPADAPPALGDPEALLLVAVNLLGNAIKYTPEGGTVRAGAEASGDGVRVYVRDSGIGIKPEDRERVVQGHRTEEGKKAAAGFGVGLTLVSTVLEAHGTSLTISGEPGKGSEFSFTLPRWVAPAASDELV